MAETQDTGATSAPQVEPVSTAPVTPEPVQSTAPSVDVLVRLASRLNYSVPIKLTDGEELSLPHHGVRSIEKSKITDADGRQIALPAGVFVVGA